jgi:hypothetical protein
LVPASVGSPQQLAWRLVVQTKSKAAMRVFFLPSAQPDLLKSANI